ncbi:MAG: FAD-dependent oxidoreductase [Burkholderiales bacterium]|nr:FAD-dependent oxidoreductase [Burkholderiales bacterium]
MAQASYDLIVIGEGIAGLTCANHAARAGLKVATFEANLFGGLVINITELEGYPEGRETSGAELASELMEANGSLAVTSVQEPVEGVVPGEGGFALRTGGSRYSARAIVAASGARLRKLGVPGEAEFEGRGVSQCADCDGPMFQNETVVVVGGGDAALQEALVLAKFCARVHVVHRGDRFRARGHFVERVSATPNIAVEWNTVLEAIEGGKMVEKVRLRRAGDGAVREFACAGVFVNVGLEPNAGYLPEAVRRDERGFVVTSDGLETAVPGLFAIGAVRSRYSGLLKDAAAEAERAAAAVVAKLSA